MKQRWLAVALTLPILALAGTVLMKSMQRASGEEVTLPITGFDPRDLLSGHYLTYRIDYGVADACPARDVPASVCLRPYRAIQAAKPLPADCSLHLRGYCDSQGHFQVASISRFYIPEQYASVLDAKVRDQQGELVIAVDRHGQAVIRDLLIAGKPWKTP